MTKNLVLIMILLSVLISVGFFTLMERKILALSQNRMSPNKTMIIGILQPIVDGVKLLKKHYLFSFKNMYIIYQVFAYLMIIIYFLFLFVLPYYSFGGNPLSVLYMLLMLSLSGFCLLLLGWSALNKFSALGSIRSMSQNMSFEVNLGVLLLMICSMLSEIKFTWMNMKSILFMGFFYSQLWLLMLMDLQRAPMDLAEGESELVSGYNVEYSSLMFTLIFMSEYLNIIILSGIFWILVMWLSFNTWLVSLTVMLMMRSCFPRLRFDTLMILFWFKVLPVNLTILMFLNWIKIISGSLEEFAFLGFNSRSP